ncbi:MAG: ComF family protein [Magnetospiraceae bacterium]
MKSLPLLRLAIDIALPPRCLKCGTVVDRTRGLCPTCWESLDFIAPPLCDHCGLPFEFDPGAGAVCGSCVGSPPPFQKARSVFRYNDASKGLILALKHGDKTHTAAGLGAWMARAGAMFAEDCDLIVPVPLHWTRLFHRRFNQAALLANAVGRQWQVPVDPMILRRVKRTPSLGLLSRDARTQTLQGAFKVMDRRQVLCGKSVVLIDDVLTSGATAAGCARALLKAGARSISVLTLARVTRAQG